MQKFKTIYADPPWAEVGGGKIKRGANRYYLLMKTKDIKALGHKIQQIMDENSHCYLWCTNNFLKDALEVMEEWGYCYKTCITWVKGKITNKLDNSSYQIKFDNISLGQYFRGMTEHCLFGVRGNIPYKIVDGKRQQGRTIIIESKSGHSQKPEKMRVMIESVSFPPFLELFGRKQLFGWTVLGNEISGYDINYDLDKLIDKINL